MRELLLKFFGTTEGDVSITLFSVWHILYIVLIIGGTFVAILLSKDRAEKHKKTALHIVAVAVPAVYIADFFIMPLAVVAAVFGMCVIIYTLYHVAVLQLQKHRKKCHTPFQTPHAI